MVLYFYKSFSFGDTYWNTFERNDWMVGIYFKIIWGQVFGDECKRIDWSWNVNYWSWVFDRWGIIIIYIFAYVWHFPKQGLKKKSEGKSWDQSMKKNICWIWTGSRNFCKKVSNSHEAIHSFLGKITIKIKTTTKKTQEAGNFKHKSIYCMQ